MRVLAVLACGLIACNGSSTKPSTGSAASPGSAAPAPPSIPGVELPEVAPTGYLPAADVGDPLLVASEHGIVVNGTPIAALTNGLVDPAEKEGGALGLKIPRLVAMLAKIGGDKPRPRLGVAIDRRLTFRLLIELLFSAKQKEAGYTSFGLLARSGVKLVVLPITLPDKRPPAAAVTLGPALGGPRPASPTPPSPGITTERWAAVNESSLTTELVTRKIQAAYMAGIKRCYKNALKVDPTLAGKVTLGLVVTKTGNVTGAQATGVNDGLDTCIAGLMSSWRFPVPKDLDGEPVENAFRISLVLVADDGDPARPPAVAGPPPPPPSPPAPPPSTPDEPRLGLILSITRTDVLVWSITGMEGTLRDPRLRVPRTDKSAVIQVGRLLADIVKRRWPDKRPEGSREIIVMADGDTSIQDVAEYFGAARASPSGTELFPEIVLSAGFE